MKTQETQDDSNVGESSLEYPSSGAFIDECGPIFDRMNGAELSRLHEAGFVANDESEGLPNTDQIIRFLSDYPFCFVAGEVEGEPCGQSPEIRVTYVGYNEEDAINAELSKADVDDSDFRKDFLLTFYDASWITVESDHFEAGYSWA